MLHLWRNSPQISAVLSKGLYSGLQGVQHVRPVLPPYVTGQTSTVERNSRETEEYWDRDFSEADRVLSLASDYQAQGLSVEGLQQNYALTGLTSVEPMDGRTESYMGHDVHSPVLLGLNGHVSLGGCMQSTVPNPYVYSGSPVSMPDSGSVGSSCMAGCYSSHLNMPGGGRSQLDKYQSGPSLFCHPARQLSTSAHHRSQSSEVKPKNDFNFEDISPQGIQGDNCVRFKLWMENCQRYNLPNCDEQLESVKAGRKTLAQVFSEQEEIIRLVAENYRKEAEKETVLSSSAQGVQQSEYNFEFSDLADPSVQGLQGEDCANFKFWAHNCQAFGFPDCAEKVQDVRDGRKTLQEIFEEQDEMIRKIVQLYESGQHPTRASSSGSSSEVGSSGNGDDSPSPSHSALPEDSNVKLSSRAKLKRAVKEYGITVNVFYISISLASLGGFYLAVSSGLDVVGILNHLGGFGEFIQSRIPTGATTFVMAYVIHKVFAPVRIALTLGCTPLIVRHLRKIGFLKPPKPS